MKSVSASPSDVTGRRLGYLLVGYLAATIGAITLAPFRFAMPDQFVAQWIVLDGGWVPDVLLNVALFIPIGLALHRTMRRTMGTVLLVAAAASLIIELLQLFLLPRYTTASDVAANIVGAVLGATMSAWLDRRIGTGQQFVGRLLLDLPLMGVVYLLLPLLWLDGLAAAGDPNRAWLGVPLAMVGALTLAAIGRTVPQAADSTIGRNVVLASATWFLVGSVPVLRINPLVALAGLATVIAVAWVAQRAWYRAVQRDRRLEPQVVRVVTPILVLYIVGLTVAPGTLQIDQAAGDARVNLLRWIEHAAALATLGYLVAEWRGRRAEGELRSVVVPMVACGALDLAIGLVAQAERGPGTFGVALIVAALGATLYRRQRDHIIALSGNQG